uniref:Optineurin n=1 Tax=Romanomermis culicivorax TaxID=13658 RepID=A0A915HJ38_ROMCU
MNNEKAIRDDEEEDFEIINDSANSVSNLDENGAIISDGLLHATLSKNESDSPVFVDTYATIEAIRREQKALKEELLETQTLLKNHHKLLENQKALSERKISDLNDRIKRLTEQTSQKDVHILSLNGQVKEFKEASEKSDEIYARMYDTEDRLRQYEDVIQRLSQNDTPANMQSCTDAILAKELRDKDDKVFQLEKECIEKDAMILNATEENLKLKNENRNLSNFVAALQAQIDADQAYIEDLKNNHQSRINALTADLDLFLRKKDKSNICSSESESENATIKESKVLSLGETHRAEAQVFICDKCQLRLPTVDLYEKHINRCPLSLDSLSKPFGSSTTRFLNNK